MHCSGILARAAILALGLSLCGAVFAQGQNATDGAPDGYTLTIVGDAEAQEALRPALEQASLAKGLDAEARADGAQVLAAAQADYARLYEALFDAGYYGAVVAIALDGREAGNIAPLSAPASVDTVEVDVTLNRRFRIGSVSIAPLAPGDALPPTMARDEPALADAVREAVRGRVDAWRDLGYAKARVAEQDITADHANDRLDMDVVLAPGDPLRVGRVRVTTDSMVRDRRIRQMAGLVPGELVTPAETRRAAARLRNTGAFRSITLTEAETPNADGTLDFAVEVVDRPPRRIGAGAEISNTNGLTLSGFWLHRNILGGGESLRFDLSAEQLGSDVENPDFRTALRFERPAVYGPDTLFFAETGFDFRDTPDFLDRTLRLEFGASRTFSDTLTGSLGISLRRSRIIDRFRPVDANGDHPQREFTLFSLPAALTWDDRDTPLDATEGYFLSTEAEPFVFLDGSGGEGLRLGADLRGYQAIGSNLVLAGRAQAGALFGPDAAQAPPDFLFYSGGGGTVRGHPFESLDADYGAERLGGRSFAALSAEARIGFRGAFGAVVFADAGFIGPQPGDFSDGAWHSGAGVGVRYDTAVGPIRFDIAGPVSGDTAKGAQIYIGIGHAF